MNVFKDRRNKNVYNLRITEGDESFTITIPLPTPYETQTILFDTFGSKKKDTDIESTGVKVIQKAMAWVNENMPTVDGMKLSLNDLSDREYAEVLSAVNDIFFRAGKQAEQGFQRTPPSEVSEDRTIPIQPKPDGVGL
jgi:hypothetical protein